LKIDQLLERACEMGAPIVEGERVTFVWEGEQAPDLIGDFTAWGKNPIQLDEASDRIWLHTEALPDDAYIEYAYLDPKKEIRLPDPFNSRSVPNGLGAINHFFYMPGAELNSFVRRRKGVSGGRYPADRAGNGRSWR
jgi:hypothetical protein